MEEQKSVMPAAPKNWYDGVPSWRRFLYMLLIACAPALLVWAYFDSATRSQDAEIERLRIGVQKLADQQNAPFVTPVPEGKMAPLVPEDWKTAEGKGYLIDLPPGYALDVNDDGYDNIYSTPRRDDDLAPYAVIVTAPAADASKYEGVAGRAVISGDTMYRIMLYENLEWKEFDQAASSLRLR